MPVAIGSRRTNLCAKFLEDAIVSHLKYFNKWRMADFLRHS